jgi:hypothetical protein
LALAKQRVTMVQDDREGWPMAHSNNIANPRAARGGKSIYGVPLGILMLEARFLAIDQVSGGGDEVLKQAGGAAPE